jgi:protein-disulfide isomerase
MSKSDDIKNKAAQERKAMADVEAKRTRNIQIIGGIVILALVVGIIGLAVWARGEAEVANSPVAPLEEFVTDAPLPTGVSAANGYGVPVNSAPSAPKFALYEDFQCPACATFESSGFSTVLESANAGDIELYFHPMIFLDRNPTAKNASLRATMAFGCAVDEGKTLDYHSAVFTLQPGDGSGWTDNQLLDLAQQVGIDGASYQNFETCFTSQKYRDWARNSQLAASIRQVPGTPGAFLNDQLIDSGTLNDPGTLLALIAEANK